MAIASRQTLGQIIRERREKLGLNRGDVVSRLKARGIKLPRSTLQSWEEANGRSWNVDWNPEFFAALAETLETSQVELLYAMGFDIVPEGLTLADLEMAIQLRKLPEPKRKQVVKALLGVLDGLGIE